MNSSPLNHRFNFIYQELVKGPDDLVGLFAYSVYKQEKIDYIVRFTEDNGGRRPKPEELLDFHRMSMSRCAQYRTLAEQYMSAVMAEVYEDAAATLESQYQEKLNRKVRDMTPSFWFGVGQSLAGAILYTVFLGLVVVLVLGARYGVEGIVQEAIKMFMR